MKSLIVFFLLCSACCADLIYSSDIAVRQNEPFYLPIFMEGQDVQSLSLAISLGSETTIQSVSYDQTIWDGFPLLTFEGVPLPASESIFNVVLNQENTGVLADGAVMFLEASTSAPPGSVIPVDLDYRGLSEAADSQSIEIPLDFRTNSITVVPEPSQWLSILLVAISAGAYCLLRPI